MMAQNRKKLKQKGIIALSSIVIVLLVVLVITVSLANHIIYETQSSLKQVNSIKAYYLSNLCAEQALMKLKENPEYSGSEIISEGNGQCEIFPIEGKWIIKVSGSYSDQVRKIKIAVSKLSPKIVIDYWQEVSQL